MIQPQKVDQIVADLIAIDPSLNTPELKTLVTKLLASKPQIQVDDKFSQELYSKLLVEISKARVQKNSPIKFAFMKKLNYALAATAAVGVVALLLVTIPKAQKQNILLPGNQKITKVSPNAFGSLANLTSVNGGRGGGGGMGGDMAAAPSATSEIANPKMAQGGGGTSEMMFAPINYKFVYKGDEFSVSSDKMAVFERIKGFNTVDLQSFLSNFNVGMFNVSKFTNAKLDHITASQDQSQGYTVSLDMKQGTAYIGQNWEKWQTAATMCRDQACYERNRIKESDLLPDDQVIAIANSFLDEFGIDKSAYGEPVIQNYWKAELERMADKSMFYFPEQIGVIYPIKIEGMEIYDESGNKSGMYVSVDIRSKKVSSVGELNSQQYQSSDYEVEQDAARIQKVAENGGYRSYLPYASEDSNAKVETYELGTPRMAYVRMWQYMDNQSKELFVPSLIFPVSGEGSQNFWMKNVTVPLVKDILNTNPNGGGEVEIMPFPATKSSVQ